LHTSIVGARERGLGVAIPSSRPPTCRRMRGASVLAERVGFEPTNACASAVFKTAAFSRSATSPRRKSGSESLSRAVLIQQLPTARSLAAAPRFDAKAPRTCCTRSSRPPEFFCSTALATSLRAPRSSDVRSLAVVTMTATSRQSGVRLLLHPLEAAAEGGLSRRRRCRGRAPSRVRGLHREFPTRRHTVALATRDGPR
jgi:hypothetical protein